MGVLLYIEPFLMSFAVSVVFLFLFQLALTYVHERLAISFRRFGGVAVILAFLISTLFNSHLVLTPAILGMVLGVVGILFFGVWDDIATLGWKTQLVFQISLGALLFFSGLRIFSLPVPFVGQVFVDALPGGEVFAVAVLILWIVFVINVLNWADGIDGLLPSVSLFAFSALFCLSVSPQVNQPPLGILAMALVGAVLGLLLFNFPPSRFFSGTTGSFFLGFSLAALSVLSGAKLATAILVLSLPMLDALWVFVERLRCRQSPFSGGDFRHLHYRLRELGWSDRTIVSGYALYTVIVGGVSLLFGSTGKTMIFLVLSVLVCIFLFRVQKKSMLTYPSSNFRKL